MVALKEDADKIGMLTWTPPLYIQNTLERMPRQQREEVLDRYRRRFNSFLIPMCRTFFAESVEEANVLFDEQLRRFEDIMNASMQTPKKA